MDQTRNSSGRIDGEEVGGFVLEVDGRFFKVKALVNKVELDPQREGTVSWLGGIKGRPLFVVGDVTVLPLFEVLGLLFGVVNLLLGSLL